MIRTLIVEDVDLARAGLRRLLGEYDDVEVVGEAATLADGFSLAAATRPTLAFLDVQLPDGDGLALARALDDPRPAIVFLTAFPDFALSAFGVEAVDYLLKPASRGEVARALDRVRRARSRSPAGTPAPRHLEIRDGGRTIFVPLEAIERIDAAGHYSCVHALGQVHLLRTPIAELIERLGSDFVRVHRSTLVRLDRIVAITDRRNGDGDIKLVDGAVVALSRNFRAELALRLAALGR